MTNFCHLLYLYHFMCNFAFDMTSLASHLFSSPGGSSIFILCTNPQKNKPNVRQIEKKHLPLQRVERTAQTELWNPDNPRQEIH